MAFYVSNNDVIPVHCFIRFVVTLFVMTDVL